MCEDRALRMKKESKAKRIHHLRFRARVSRLSDIQHQPEQSIQPQPEPTVQPQVEATSQQPEPSSSSSSSSSQSSEGFPSPFPLHLNIPEAKAFAAVMEQVEPGVYRYKKDALCNLSPEVKARNERLIEIALKTVILIKRNQQLQKRLAALQVETSSFITNVMNTSGTRQTPPADGAENDGRNTKSEKSE